MLTPVLLALRCRCYCTVPIELEKKTVLAGGRGGRIVVEMIDVDTSTSLRNRNASFHSNNDTCVSVTCCGEMSIEYEKNGPVNGGEGGVL